MAFVHLHSYSEYSIGESVINIEAMVRRAAQLDMPAVAVTDADTMAGLPELQRACDAVREETGKIVKPLFGCELTVLDDTSIGAIDTYRRHDLVLLAKDATGYANLCYLCSVANDAVAGVRLAETVLDEHARGIVAIASTDDRGTVGLTTPQRQRDFAAWVRRMTDVFDEGDFYIELQNQGRALYRGMRQNQLNAHLVGTARELGVPIVAVNGCHMLDQQDATALFALYCRSNSLIAADAWPIVEKLTLNRDFKTEQRMREIFEHFSDACDATMEIAQKCTFRLPLEQPKGGAHHPCPPLPEGRTAFEVLYAECEAGLKRRFKQHAPDAAAERLGYELGAIGQMGIAADLLVAREIADWCRENAVMVGPGRGTTAGSVACYALGITQVDPIAHGLLSERFIDPATQIYPHIDMDIEFGARERVLDHLREVYGDSCVAAVSTRSTISAKAAVTIAANYLECNPETAEAVQLADGITGVLDRQYVHACAVVLSDQPLENILPLRFDSESDQVVSQFNAAECRERGCLVVSFSELSALAVMRDVLDGIAVRTGRRIDPGSIPTDDPQTLDLLASGNANIPLRWGPDDLNETYLRKLDRVRPEDVTAMFALCVHGPMENGMLENYLGTANGEYPQHCPDQRLRPILDQTNGLILFQEQLMQIAKTMCGFDGSKANQLRIAMFEGRQRDLRQLEEDWMRGACEAKFTEQIAKRLWGNALHLGKYTFRKAHAAAYAILYLRMAWLQANYTLDYMAAMLTHTASERPQQGDQPFLDAAATCRICGVALLPPNINESQPDFAVAQDESGILYGLAHIALPDARPHSPAYLGSERAGAIAQDREANGPFASPEDYVSRMRDEAASDSAIRALVESGAFDTFGTSRRSMLQRLLGQFNAPGTDEWSIRTKMHLERQALGLYVSDSPMNHCRFEDGPLPPIGGLPQVAPETYTDTTTRISGADIDRAFAGDEAAQNAVARCWLDGRDQPIREHLAHVHGQALPRFPQSQAIARQRDEAINGKIAEDIDRIKRWAER